VGAEVEFRVDDCGPGIRPDNLERVFERFYTDRPEGSFGSNSGLGLSICAALTTMMGGEIDAAGRPGEGAEFTVRLPLQRAVAPRQERAAPVIDVNVLKGMKVLMAEDHPTNQKVVQIILDPFGIDLTIVGNGEEAVAAWSEHRFDAVLMDMQMPVMDGLTATRAIREREAADGRPRALIIMLTANAMDEHVEAAHAAGADLHIAKPLRPAQLVAALAAAAEDPAPEAAVVNG
jgi:CheY-like chemotaxis protein